MMRRLPPGFRFEPTEEELVFEYLKCKVFSSALPASIIPEINGVWNLDPWDIPAGPAGGGSGDDEEKYLFSKKSEYENNNEGIIGWSRSGYWKARGRSEKEIVSNEIGMGLIGMKNTLDFFYKNKKKTKTKKKTGWVMHQYRLIIPHSSTNHHQFHLSLHNNNKWVLCRILSNNHHPRLPYSISSTNNHHDNLMITTPTTAFSDDDSVSSTASSSSTSPAFTDFTSPTPTN